MTQAAFTTAGLARRFYADLWNAGREDAAPDIWVLGDLDGLKARLAGG